MMEDKIGLALGANRIAVNYFNAGDYDKSIEFHLKNQELSDPENNFAILYDLGICHRKINDLEKSLDYFQQAFAWAHQREEIESECLSYG